MAAKSDWEDLINDSERAPVRYSAVAALIISWEDSDLDSPNSADATHISDTRQYTQFEEIEAFQNALVDSLGCTVHPFRIPSEEPMQALFARLASFVLEHAKSGSLVIIYYSGHCAAETDEKEMHAKVIWAAKRSGGPSLQWSGFQFILEILSGDVLLIWDCCDAAWITVAEKPRGKFELLAATAKDAKTPGPHPRSFTSVLTKHLKAQCKDGASISVEELKFLLAEDPRLRASPFYHNYTRNAQTRITLKHINSCQEGFFEQPCATLVVKVLVNDLNKGHLIEWLKRTHPKGVSDVSIEAVITHATSLQRLNNDKNFAVGPLLSRLSESTLTEILDKLEGHSIEVEKAVADADRGEGASIASDAYARIQASSEAVEKAIEEGFVSELSAHDLGSLAPDSLKVLNNVRDLLKTRIRNLEGEEEPPSEDLKSDLDLGRHHITTGLTVVDSAVVDFFAYIPAEGTREPRPTSWKQLLRLASMLQCEKPRSFCIPQCEGYVIDRDICMIGLVFKPILATQTGVKVITLESLYTSAPLVPLDLRVRLAYVLVNALQRFHWVEWVHKNFRSSKVAFISNERSPDRLCGNTSVTYRIGTQKQELDLTIPYIFGYEYCRPEDADTNHLQDSRNRLFQHPDRWVRNMSYTKAYDIYSLGVMLAEIAFWEPISSVVKWTQMTNDNRANGRDVFETLIRRIDRKLPHMVGSPLTKAARACLTFKDDTALLSDTECQEWFRSRVREPLYQAISGYG